MTTRAEGDVPHPKIMSATSVASRARWAALSSPAITLPSTSTAAMHKRAVAVCNLLVRVEGWICSSLY